MSAVGEFIQNTVGSIVDAAPVILPVAAAAFGGPALAAGLGGGLAGAAGAGAIIGGVTSALSGRDPLTGALTGGLTGYLGGVYNDLNSFASGGITGSGPSLPFSEAELFDQAEYYMSQGLSEDAAAAKALSDAKDLAQGFAPVAAPSSSPLTNIATRVLGANSSAGKTNVGGLLTGGANLLGSYINTQAAKDAATTQALATIDAAKIAAESARFKPVGVTTRFGASKFGYDPSGNINAAGYALSPELKAQQDTLFGLSDLGLAQYAGGMPRTLPMGTAADRMMALGNQYLATTPQEQAAKYIQEQQALLAPTRERDLAQLQAQLQAQGRMGLATGGTSTGMMPANPELEAFYNAKRMQDLQLAAQATQGGQQYAQFGGAMTGLGGDMLKQMYGTQTAAFAPYQTSLGGATALEALGQQPMDIGINIGAKGTASNAQAGMLLGQGMQQAANITGQQAMQAGSPWGNLLQGGANMMQGMQSQQQQQQQMFQNQLLTALSGRGA